MNDRISRYQFGQTHWSLVFEAGKKEGDAAVEARQELLIHYSEAIFTFLRARLRDDNAAGEVFSNFAERVLKIHPFLERADPEKGRFRDYLRSVLQRMIFDYHREGQRERKHRRGLVEGTDQEPAAQPAPLVMEEEEATFRQIWTDELLNLAWKSLERLEMEGGQPYHSLLMYKGQNPKARSEAIAQHFTKLLGRTLSSDNVRQLLVRAKKLLNDLLIEEVARSLQRKKGEKVTPGEIEDELLQLDLLDENRRDALERYRGKC